VARPPERADGDAKIRHAKSDDVAAIAELDRTCPEAAHWSRESYEQSIGRKEFLFLLCERDATITGFLLARQFADEAEILNLAVSAPSRRKGNGGALLQKALQEFQASRISRVFLEARISNSTAISFYRKHGFAVTGKRVSYYRDPVEDAICMTKMLTPTR
jgi:ribosomal-protein-alanine acetyltransferase